MAYNADLHASAQIVKVYLDLQKDICMADVSLKANPQCIAIFNNVGRGLARRKSFALRVLA